jgi:hypothetical protein
LLALLAAVTPAGTTVVVGSTPKPLASSQYNHKRHRNICTLCICLANVKACCKYLSISAPVTNAESYLIFTKSFATCADDKSNFKSYYGADNKFVQ